MSTTIDDKVKQFDQKRKKDFVNRLNEKYAVARHGGEVLIVVEDGDEVNFILPSDLHLWHANDKVKHTVKGKDKDKEIWTIATKSWLESTRRRQYTKIVFDPRDTNRDHYNLWRGFSVKPNPEGSCAKFLAHVKDNICAGSDEYYNWVIGFLAHLVQRPWEKPGVAIALRGREGTGKGYFAKVVGDLICQHYVVVSHSTHITGRFNSHLKRAMLVFVDEGFWAGDKSGEGALKHLITDVDVLIEGKHKDAIMLKSMHRFIIASNENWVVPAGFDARRWFVLDVLATHMGDRSYFNAIEEELSNGGLGALMHLLMTFDLGTVDLFTAPKTAALLQQKESSLDLMSMFWLDALKQGYLRYSQNNDGDIRDTSGWPAQIYKDGLFSAYAVWAREHNVRSRLESSSGFHRWFKQKNLLPGSTEQRPGDDSTIRKRHITLPPLAQCRDAWDALTGQPADWDDELLTLSRKEQKI
jgi:hypothetical protein